MGRFSFVAILASAFVADAFAPHNAPHRRAQTVCRQQPPNGGNDDDESEEPPVEQPLWRSPLQGLGGDYANMEQVYVDRPIPVGYAPPPRVTRRSIQDVSFGPAPAVAPRSVVPHGGTATVPQPAPSPPPISSSSSLQDNEGGTAMGYVPQDQAPEAAAVESGPSSTGLSGLGGDAGSTEAAPPAQKELFIYGSMSPKVLSGLGGDDVSSVNVAPPAEKGAVDPPTEDQRQQHAKSKPTLKGIGGDYSNMEVRRLRRDSRRRCH